MTQLALVAAAVALLAVPGPAMAQMDWLTPSLENQRHHNLRRHQQRLKQRNDPPDRQIQGRPTITPAQRQAAWSRHKTEYRRVLLRQGQPAADRWLDQQILAGR